MKTGYDQFFKKAGQARQNGETRGENASRRQLEFQLSEALEQQDEKLRRNLPVKSKKKKKSSFSWKLTGFSLLGFVLALYGFQNYENIEKNLKKIEIGFFGMALAEDGHEEKKTDAHAPATKVGASAEAGTSASKEVSAIPGEKVAKADAAATGFDHLEKLNERKKQLDAREEELNRLEAEIQAQKIDLEKRMEEVKNMRNEISSILDDRVKADEQKVEVLVQVYSNMKPQQAAQVFGTMDEDLAIEILGRMKKKSAADIMNLIKPDKAQILSEKFAGYKRKPSSNIPEGSAKPAGEEKK